MRTLVCRWRLKFAVLNPHRQACESSKISMKCASGFISILCIPLYHSYMYAGRSSSDRAKALESIFRCWSEDMWHKNTLRLLYWTRQAASRKENTCKLASVCDSQNTRTRIDAGAIGDGINICCLFFVVLAVLKHFEDHWTIRTQKTRFFFLDKTYSTWKKEKSNTSNKQKKVL